MSKTTMPRYIATYHANIQHAFDWQAYTDEHIINAVDDQTALVQARKHLKTYETSPRPDLKIPPSMPIGKIEVSLESIVEVRDIPIQKSKLNKLCTVYEKA